MLFLTSIDSATTQTILESLDSINKKTSIVWWVPVTAALVGGVLVWLGQAIDRYAKNNREVQTKKVEMFAQLELYLIKIKNALKEIARHKSHRKYWRFCYLEEFHKRYKDLENEKMYGENSMTSATDARLSELELNRELANYYSTLASYNTYVKNRIDTSGLQKLIESYELEHANEFPDNVNLEDFCDSEIARLVDVYFRKFSILEDINKQIKASINGKEKG